MDSYAIFKISFNKFSFLFILLTVLFLFFSPLLGLHRAVTVCRSCCGQVPAGLEVLLLWKARLCRAIETYVLVFGPWEEGIVLQSGGPLCVGTVLGSGEVREILQASPCDGNH